MSRRAPTPPLFPYTTLFRSSSSTDTQFAARIHSLQDGHPEFAALGSVAGVPATDPSTIKLNQDRKSTRLNSSHLGISYAVFCLKKKNARIHLFMKLHALGRL